MPPPKLCWFFLKPSFSHSFDDTIKELSKDFHSVPGSQDVHTQRHFQQHLSFLEISFTSTTGPQRLQRHHTQQSPLLPGLQSPALLSPGLGERSVSSFCAFTLPSAIPSSMSLVSSTAFAYIGSWALGTGFACDESELVPSATAEVMQPERAPVPSAWGTERRSCSPMCHYRLLTWME